VFFVSHAFCFASGACGPASRALGWILRTPPLRLCNEYDLGTTTWTDFYQGHRKIARVYTHYYRHGKAVNGSTLPELLWVRAESDPDTESDEYS
jgi:hypothetical protein